MMNRFTTSACNALKTALSCASDMGHTYIGSEHILLGLLSEKNTAAYKLLSSVGISYERSRDMLVKSAGKGVKTDISASDMTPKTKSIIENAYHLASVYNCQYVATEHLLLSLIREDDCVGTRLISNQGVSLDSFDAEVTSYCSSTPTIASPFINTEKAKHKSASIKNGLFGKNLTELAIKGRTDPVIGRESETLRIIRILSRRTKNNPVLIGEPGVGKTAVVEGLAQRIAEGSVPENLIGKQIYSLDITSLIAGAKYRGEFEERFKQIIDEASNNPNIILFIDEIHNLVGAGAAEGAIDGANILKPMLARGELQIIGATTVSEYRKIEKDAALERRFQSILVEEPSIAQTVTILSGLRDKYEAHHKLKISDSAIKSAAYLSARYINDRFLPDKAIDLIDEAAARVRLGSLTFPEEIRVLENKMREISADIENAIRQENFILAAKLRTSQEELSDKIEEEKTNFKQKPDNLRITVEESDIEQVVTELTKIPISTLAKQEKTRLLSLEREFSEKIIGQDDAISAISNSVRRGRLGLKKERCPTGSFIFAGPTGVGKTESAKILAELIYGGSNALISLDMSEYSEKHSISRLIGAPPGYVGYEEGGRLTEKVRKRPYSVVLFDEIEKAHPDICNLLLQILDEGRLTDSSGRSVDFSNTVVILTTNIGAEKFADKRRTAGFSDTGKDYSPLSDSVKSAVTKELSSHFRSELLNRIDEIVIFSPLSREAVLKISEIYLKKLCLRLEERDISAEFTQRCVSAVSEAAYSKEHGARQIERYIYTNIEGLITRAILSDKIGIGDRIIIDHDHDKQDFVILSKNN